MHALFDGMATNTPSITKIGVGNFARQAVQAVGMTLIGGPWVEEDGDACYGLALLAESHISIHLNRTSGAFHVDIFSCKPFDNCVLLSVISRWLDIRELQMRILDRGNLYIGPPRPIRKSEPGRAPLLAEATPAPTPPTEGGTPLISPSRGTWRPPARRLFSAPSLSWNDRRSRQGSHPPLPQSFVLQWRSPSPPPNRWPGE